MFPADVANETPAADRPIDASTADAPAAALICPSAGASGVLAEWRANGNLANNGSCPALQAVMRGTVPYGPSREDRAWYFRSTNTMGDDPNYLSIPVPGDVSLWGAAAGLTLDAWVRPVGFNAYNNSNRQILQVNTVFNAPGAAQLYVHQDGHLRRY